VFFSHPPPTTDPHPLSLHDALPICFDHQLVTTIVYRFETKERSLPGQQVKRYHRRLMGNKRFTTVLLAHLMECDRLRQRDGSLRSEEHTSELQSRENLVCRLLLEKK